VSEFLLHVPPQDGKEIQRSFKHLPSTIGAFQPEEVGVEHLVRDVNDPSVSSLASQVSSMPCLSDAMLQRLLPPAAAASVWCPFFDRHTCPCVGIYLDQEQDLGSFGAQGAAPGDEGLP